MNERYRPLYAPVAALALVVMANGCAPDDGLVPVAGTVTVDGVAPGEGMMTFVPLGGVGKTTGTVITNGAYQARVAPGRNQVSVHVEKVAGEVRKYPDDPGSPMKQVLVESLSPRYNSETELELNASQDGGPYDFDLSTD